MTTDLTATGLTYDTDGAVSATLSLTRSDTAIGAVTLYPRPADDELDTWGELDTWADDGVIAYLDAATNEPGDDRCDRIREIVGAVREAVDAGDDSEITDAGLAAAQRWCATSPSDIEGDVDRLGLDGAADYNLSLRRDRDLAEDVTTQEMIQAIREVAG